MRKIFTTLERVLLTPVTPLILCLFLIGGTAVPIITGCNTVGTTAYKVEAVVIPTVDAAMNTWGDWVRAGKATQAQVDAVKGYYNQYYAAQLKLHDALVKYVSASSSTNSAPVESAALSAASAAASAAATALTANIGAVTKGK